MSIDHDPPPAKRRRLVFLAVLRSVLAATVLVPLAAVPSPVGSAVNPT